MMLVHQAREPTIPNRQEFTSLLDGSRLLESYYVIEAVSSGEDDKDDENEDGGPCVR